ncbi:Cytochrome c [Candidatus Karelsulcia muelleri DMIN]|uniref:Cytochrome c n=1 Tax=Karelsulcia muelleri (strain DMIN) TaxID=641892 RepID=D5D8J4_KARMD|nr:Cytochrome c [Candidatus Karelsulcia muelleri DMIN]
MTIFKKKIKLLMIFFCILFIQNCNCNSTINLELKNGKELFKKNCTACHSLDLKKKLVGPPLYGINEKRNNEWLHKWIKNNKKLRESGDKDAIALYNKYNKSEMTLFPKLSSKDIDDILYFIKNKNNEIIIQNNNKLYNNFKDPFIKICFLGFIIINILLIRLILIIIKFPFLKKNYNSKYQIKFLFDKINNKLIIKLIKTFLKFRKIIFIKNIIFIIYIIWNFWIYMMNIDVNKGYKPNQPIFFSHKIHSGINNIHCQYCHSSSLYSKVSGIPSLNICMNCHISINEYNGNYIPFGKDKCYFDNEIRKIYKYLGWNETNRNLSDKKSNIKWIRIHNMPDFVYFDHSQHIIVAGKEIKKSKNVDLVCEACHGYVKNMDKISMFNDFTMEWCIKCHKHSNVNYNNKYYLNYYKNNLLNKRVSYLGGIECGKCHY